MARFMRLEVISTLLDIGLVEAVGMGNKLITAQAVKDKDYDGIAKKASDCIGWIKKARG